ncbi:uncharacterized protein LOC107764441 [Nicotiana tabacum]|uniref:Uncharacterized protein n=1 Tax=Nicotiana tabacum TaxID=4097 RepID=A0A1S3XFE4_TOBAC|nr:PREDICTED: uncharacterized protein LOC107764441 [Nicotiana tabacum]XP_016438490.1 PREDICTED: uncharacterized protein LOC107764441 [Nicotiana tabacum]
MGLYIMKNFVVCPDNMKLETKDHKFKLMFTHQTTVDEIHDPHFNMCILKFRTYEQLSNPQEFDNTELFVVIGKIVSYEDVQSIKKQDDNIHVYMNIEIQDYETCPEERREAVKSLIFAAARLADVPELCQLRSVFTEIYENSLVKSKSGCSDFYCKITRNIRYWSAIEDIVNDQKLETRNVSRNCSCIVISIVSFRI